MRDRRVQQRVTVVLGIVLAIAMGASLMLPLLQQLGVNAAPPAVQPTDVPPPTQPPPIADLSSIRFEEPYLHPTGLFTAVVPSGWSATNEATTANEARVTFNNAAQLSVVEMRVIEPTGDLPLDSVEDLHNVFTNTWLQQSWSSYTSWDEDARRIEGAEMILDFSLERLGQEFIARQVSFTDGTWVYSLRVVTPSNASQMLQFVLNNVRASFQPVEAYVGTPLDWSAYFDNDAKHLIRYPDSWTLTDSAPGAPTSIAGSEGNLRVETIEVPVDSADAARAWVQQARPGADVVSVEEFESLGGIPGYRVAYQLRNLDGATESGLAVLLNAGGSAHVANMLLSESGIQDLNADELPEAVSSFVATLETFALFPDLQIGNPSVE